MTVGAKKLQVVKTVVGVVPIFMLELERDGFSSPTLQAATSTLPGKELFRQNLAF